MALMDSLGPGSTRESFPDILDVGHFWTAALMGPGPWDSPGFLPRTGLPRLGASALVGHASSLGLRQEPRAQDPPRAQGEQGQG